MPQSSWNQGSSWTPPAGFTQFWPGGGKFEGPGGQVSAGRNILGNQPWQYYQVGNPNAPWIGLEGPRGTLGQWVDLGGGRMGRVIDQKQEGYSGFGILRQGQYDAKGNWISGTPWGEQDWQQPTGDQIRQYIDQYGSDALLAGGMTADAINRALEDKGDKGRGGGGVSGEASDYYGSNASNVGMFSRSARARAGRAYAMSTNPSSSANYYGGRAGTRQGAFSWAPGGGYGSNIQGNITGGQWANMASQASREQGLAFAGNVSGMGLTRSSEGPDREMAGASSARQRSMQISGSGDRMHVPWYISMPNNPINQGGHSTDAPSGYRLNPAEHRWLAMGGVNSGAPPVGVWQNIYPVIHPTSQAPSQPAFHEPTILPQSQSPTVTAWHPSVAITSQPTGSPPSQPFDQGDRYAGR